MTLSQAIGQAILESRLERGMSQRVLVAKMGRSENMRTYLSKVETGMCVPNIENIHVIAQALGMQTYQIVMLAESLMKYPLPEKKFREVTQRVNKRAVPIDAKISDPAAMARRREIAKKLGVIPMEAAK